MNILKEEWLRPVVEQEEALVFEQFGQGDVFKLAGQDHGSGPRKIRPRRIHPDYI